MIRVNKRPRKHDDPASSANGTTSNGAGSSGAAGRSAPLAQASPDLDVGLSLPRAATCHVVRYHIKQGDNVRSGDLLASCKNDTLSNIVESRSSAETSDDIVEFRAPADGVVTKIYLKENENFNGMVNPILQISFCIHNVVIAGLCAICGRTVDESSSDLMQDITSSDGTKHAKQRDTATINVEGGLRLEVTRDEALKVRESTVTRLFQIRKLSLVLDLDHTLVHCTDDPRAMAIAQNAPASTHLHTFELDGKLLVLKLRPGLPAFLRTMKEKYYEMHVYTAGTRAYAQKVCSIIDPDGSCFGGRIISRDDTPELGTDKDLTRIFPVDDTMVVIVDDRDVWNGVANLLTCEPFDYFRGMHDVNNPGWRTMSGEEGSTSADEADTSAASGSGVSAVRKPTFAEEETDAGLARFESILKQVHGKFYYSNSSVSLERQLDGAGSDVKVILRDLRLAVLRKVIIAFDPDIKPKNPEVNVEDYLNTLFAKASACGATLVDKVDAQTSHLVSTGDTELANYGKQRGIWVVRPEWLEKSEHYWQRVKEEPFSVFRTYGTRAKPASPIVPVAGESSSSAAVPAASAPQTEEKVASNEADDIEDFARELELSMAGGGGGQS